MITQLPLFNCELPESPEHLRMGYRLNELSEHAKGQALERLTNQAHENWDSNDSDMVGDAIKETMNDMGLGSLEIAGWSLGYCQGDGVAFKGDLNLFKVKAKNAKLRHLVNALNRRGVSISVSVSNSSRYCHQNSMSVSIDADSDIKEQLTELEDTAVKLLEDEINGLLRDCSLAAEKAGYAEIEYRTGEECAAEMAVANDMRFTRSGRIFHQLEDE